MNIPLELAGKYDVKMEISGADDGQLFSQTPFVVNVAKFPILLIPSSIEDYQYIVEAGTDVHLLPLFNGTDSDGKPIAN